MNAPNTSRGPHEGQLSGERSIPPGVLPKNLQYWALGGIAVLVISTTFFSGQKTKPAAPSSVPVTPSPSQLANFREALERQRREAEEARKRLAEMEKKEPPPSRPQEVGSGSSEVDPLIQRRRAKAEAAPFASNVSVRVEEKRGSKEEKTDLESQVAFRVERASGGERDDSTTNTSDEAEGSGKFLPSKEGDLYRLFESTMIPSILANQLDGSFTGPVKTIVSENVRSKDGVALLIPAGSQFIGEAHRVEAQNQTRLAISFKRLLLPNDYSVDLKSAPGLDRSGQTGVTDKVNNHRLRTFGLSGAIGLLGGIAHFGGQGNPYAWGVGTTMGNSATSVLSHYLNAVPTITIRKGHQMMVYLPNDLLLPEYRR